MREEKDLFELSLKNIVADLKNYFHMNPKSINLLQNQDFSLTFSLTVIIQVARALLPILRNLEVLP